MSSKSTASRLGSFFGIGNKHSTKRAAAQKENLSGFRDAQHNTLPSASRAQHDPPYLDLDVSRDASHRSLPAQHTRTQTESRQSNSQKMHYPQSLYTLPDVDPFSATSPISLPTSPNARSPDYNTLSNSRPLLIQTSSDTNVPAPSPFGSPIDHGQNASGYSLLHGRLVFTSDPTYPALPIAYYRLMTPHFHNVQPRNIYWRTPLSELQGPPSRILSTQAANKPLDRTPSGGQESTIGTTASRFRLTVEIPV